MSKLSTAEFPRDAWDLYVYGSSIVQDHDGTFRMLYIGYESSVVSGPCIATSTDMINWTKPNVGQVIYDGNTNNNIIIQYPGIQGYDLLLDNSLYVVLLWTPTSGDIYTSHDGINFEFLTTAATQAGHGAYMEVKSLLHIDGVWRLYYVQGHSTQRRSVGYYESPTIGGVYVDQGLISEFTATTQTDQYYDSKSWECAGSLWTSVPKFNFTTEILGPLMLYKSDDSGVNWNYQGNIIENGASGEWDEKLIAEASPILVDKVWKMVYTASAQGHNIWPRPMDFGLATS